MPKLLLDKYLTEIRCALGEQEDRIEGIIKVLSRAKDEEHRVWILGNGGSLAIAQHFAQDLLKCHGVRAQCMNDASVITAFSNDNGFDRSIVDPLRTLIDPNDVIIVFSCSGKSRNYDAIFNEMGNKKIAIVGTDGGFMKHDADISVHVESDDYRVCETAFGIVADLVNIGMER